MSEPAAGSTHPRHDQADRFPPTAGPVPQPGGPVPQPGGPVPPVAGPVVVDPARLSSGLASSVLDHASTAAGWLVASGLGFVLGLYGAFFAPMYLFGVRFPLALLLALVGNPLLAWFAYAATGRRGAGLAPAALWCAVWFTAASRTTEGDLLVADNNWVGLTTLVAGPLAFAVTIFVIVTRGALRSGGPAR